MRLTDNQQDISKQDFLNHYPKLANQLLDFNLEQLAKEENLLIFPNDLLASDDLDKASKVFETVGHTVKTSNVIGFIGCQDEQLIIHSRFDHGEHDFFLHYLLQQVLHINLTYFDTSLSMAEQFYQFLVYLFPKYLQAALRKGLYKEYQTFHYNDSQIKGQVNIAQHIKNNIPFRGNIAYATREFTTDNPLNQLIRHTIEYIQTTQVDYQMILRSSQSDRDNMENLLAATPSYRYTDRQQIIFANLKKPIRHAYFHEYRALQNLCLMILQGRKHSVGETDERIHGILFDMSWLWEEYLATLLVPSFIHPRNRRRQDGLSVFQDWKRPIYPDFYKADRSLVLDAKYKRLETTKKGISREDLYQLISYIHVLQAKKGGLIYPSQSVLGEEIKIGVLAGYGGELSKYPLQIPQGVNDFQSFVQSMKVAEKTLLSSVNP